jgi:hypothetical protein
MNQYEKIGRAVVEALAESRASDLGSLILTVVDHQRVILGITPYGDEALRVSGDSVIPEAMSLARTEVKAASASNDLNWPGWPVTGGSLAPAVPDQDAK